MPPPRASGSTWSHRIVAPDPTSTVMNPYTVSVPSIVSSTTSTVVAGSVRRSLSDVLSNSSATIVSICYGLSEYDDCSESRVIALIRSRSADSAGRTSMR